MVGGAKCAHKSLNGRRGRWRWGRRSSRRSCLHTPSTHPQHSLHTPSTLPPHTLHTPSTHQTLKPSTLNGRRGRWRWGRRSSRRSSCWPRPPPPSPTSRLGSHPAPLSPLGLLPLSPLGWHSLQALRGRFCPQMCCVPSPLMMASPAASIAYVSGVTAPPNKRLGAMRRQPPNIYLPTGVCDGGAEDARARAPRHGRHLPGQGLSLPGQVLCPVWI